ncbi:serine/threonine-protein kinase MRCK [Nematocida major]|uniref:serine/threonine-protein kinase MRCK n=1 Tax=Nematocida major TaxID=1912982 RepID=UPI002008A32D|nr:serine/threonine-protein kinase MRCK [Nematocida major]KAH9387403.1 serine/threonine-protein kinase MRCK [Nematocida major]
MQEKKLRLHNEEANLLIDCAQAISFAGIELPEIGKILAVTDREENYEILHRLAKGGHSEVFVVRCKRTLQVYALKKVFKQDIVEDPLANPVMRERDSMIRGRASEWLLGLHRSFQDGAALYFLTDFIRGGDLGSLCCRKGPFPEEFVRFFGGEAILALEELHGAGFVHRDVKPENILIDADGHIKLADFGSCTRLSSDDHRVVVGTPDYVAPEVLGMSGRLSEKTDLWSLGVVVYEMAFGVAPFYAETIRETYNNILEMKYVIPACSPELERVISGMLCAEENRLGISSLKEEPFFRGFDFSGKGKNVPVHVPGGEGETLENFEVEEFVPAQGRETRSICVQGKFVGFGYDPEIVIVSGPEFGEPEKKPGEISEHRCRACENAKMEVPAHESVPEHALESEKEPECMPEHVPESEKESECMSENEKESECMPEEEETPESMPEEVSGKEPESMPKEEKTPEEVSDHVPDHAPESISESEKEEVPELEEKVVEKIFAPESEKPENEKSAESVQNIEETLQKSVPSPQESGHMFISACEQERRREERETLSQISRLEEALREECERVLRIDVSALQKCAETAQREGLKLVQTVREYKARSDESSYQARWLIRKLQGEIRDTQGRIEREVAERVRLTERVEEAEFENRKLLEQIRRLKLASNVYNFPIKIYFEKKWESTTLHLEEDHLRIKEIRLPLSKIYFQDVKKNELLRINSKGESLSFKLLLPSEDDVYTEQTESSSEHVPPAGEDQELLRELEKEQQILEGIERMLKTMGSGSSSIVPMALKQKEGTEKKIHEIKQALQMGISADPALIRYSNHAFRATNFQQGVQIWCHVCNRLLYGETKQGLLCRGCKMVCHKECHTLVAYSCELQQAMERGISIILMAKQLEDKERIKAIVGSGQP